MSYFAKDTPVPLKITVPARVDKKMGMGVIHSNGQIFISSIAPGSIASEYFQLRDRIISINGVNVKDKKHCKELILSASTESEFDVLIERRTTTFQLPVVAPAETEPMPDLQFTIDDKPEVSVSTPKVKSPKSKKQQPEQPKVDYNSFGDDEFAFVDPLDGLLFPAPPDVREILTLRSPQILKDFLLDDDRDSPSKRSPKSKSPSADSTKFENKNILQNIGSDVPKTKPLMKRFH